MLDWEWDMESNPDRMLGHPRLLAASSHRKLWPAGIAATKQFDIPPGVYEDWAGAIKAAEIAVDEPHRTDFNLTRSHRRYGSHLGPQRQWVVDNAIYNCLRLRCTIPLPELAVRIKEILWRIANIIVEERHSVGPTVTYPDTPHDHPANACYDTVRSKQTDIFRCIFGNPFRPVAFRPEWRTPTAVALAAGMYAARDFGAMPFLADALEDAGCDHPDVLAHCRGPGPHARGCWVVDMILGKG